MWKHGGTLALAALVLLALSYAGIMVADDFALRDRRARADIGAAVDDFRSVTEAYFATYEAALRAIGETACVRSRGALPCGDLFERLNGRFPDVVNFAAFDRHGRFFASGQPLPTANPPDASRFSFFEALARHERHLFVMDPHKGPVSGEQVTGMVLALTDADGNFDGGIGISLRFDELTAIWRRVRAVPDIGAAVFDRHGSLVFATAQAGALARLGGAELIRVRDQLAKGDGVLRIGADSWLFHTAVVPDNDWMVAALHPGPYGLAEYLADSPLLPRLLVPTLALGALALLLSFRDWRRASALEGRVAARTAELTASNRELARINRELETFAYVASHDLREPLRTVSSYVTLLERRYTDRLDEDGRAFIAFARDGAKRANTLVLDLLDYCQTACDANPPEMLSSRQVALETVAELVALVEESGAEVTVAEEMPALYIDRLDLQRLLQNLIQNGIRYRHPDRPPVVAVSAVPEGDGWVFEVADNGIGIEPQYFDRIFVLFQRLYPETNPGGTGIGLTVCRKVVEHHGGRIWVESVPGQGSRFRFTLPGALPRAASAAAAVGD